MCGNCRIAADYIGSSFGIEYEGMVGDEYEYDHEEDGYYGVVLDNGAQKREDLIWCHEIGHREIKEVYLCYGALTLTCLTFISTHN